MVNFWPSKRDLKEVLITSLWAFISWVIGSILLVLLILLISNFINVFDSFSAAQAWAWKSSIIFTITLSIVAFIVTSLSLFITYYFLSFSNPERYKKNNVILGQIAFFTFLTYLFVIPAYIYAWNLDYDYLIVVFLIHTIFVVFWVNLIIEILNNYRYILVSVYWSFIAVFIVMLLVSLIFSFFDSNSAKLISLLFLLPFINFLQVFIKWIFDFAYYHYNRLTNQDQIWDIFYQIELEEKEALREEEEKNLI